MPSASPAPISDLAAMSAAFGWLTTVTGYWPVLLAFALITATVFALKRGGYA